MNADEIAAVYQELGDATLRLDFQVERGPQYLLEQLQECRRKQDQISQLQVRIQRELAGVKRARRAARALVALNQRHPESAAFETAKADLEQAENQYDELTALRDAVAVARGTLRATDSDIRLSASLVDMQMKLGQVRPPSDVPDAVPPVQTAVESQEDPNDLAVFYQDAAEEARNGH